MRAIWKGYIQFSLVTIPIKIYNAIDSAETVSFNLLHKSDYSPVGLQKYCKAENKVLAADEIVKGYEYEKGKYVIVEPDDLAAVKLKTTHTVELMAFVDKTEVKEVLFDAPYFAAPDGEIALKSYALFLETLRTSGKVAIGKVVLRDRESIMMISAENSGLLLNKLRYPSEVRSMAEVPLLDDVEAVNVPADQLRLAQMLMESMMKPFAEVEMVDHYTSAVREMVQSKVEGTFIRRIEPKQETTDLMRALTESIKLKKVA